jgi:hypothetical protein
MVMLILLFKVLLSMSQFALIVMPQFDMTVTAAVTATISVAVSVAIAVASAVAAAAAAAVPVPVPAAGAFLLHSCTSAVRRDTYRL